MRRKKSPVRRIPALLFFLITAIIIGQGRGALADGPAAPTLVIDAGHGGADGGAVAIDGQLESRINLDIALKLQTLCRLFGVEPVMTRETESLEYPSEAATIHQKKVWDQKRRVQCINAADNAVLLSIHQNKYPDARPSGVQVFYGAGAGSDAFAQLTHDALTQALCPESRRVPAPISRDIYLFQRLDCPAILVECGFLSNPSDAEKLASDAYRCQVAVILMASYLQYIS